MKKRDYLDTEILNSFIGETDRGSVLIIGEWLSDLLMALLLSHMPNRDHRKKGFNDIFGVRGELGSFSSRIKISYAFGLITKETYADLERIRDLRNDFAHALEIRDLRDPRVLQILATVRGAAEELTRKCSKHNTIDDCEIRFSSKGIGTDDLDFIQEGSMSRQRFALLRAFLFLLSEIRSRKGKSHQ